MIRLAGILLVMGAAVWFGSYFAMKERYRLQELEELERGLFLLQGQIRYLSAPLAEAFAGIGWQMSGQLGEVFQQTSEKLKERKGESAEKIWQQEWLSVHTFLTAEDMEQILAFGRSLGYLDKEQQENSIRLLLRYIEDSVIQGRKRLEKNGRLYYGISGLTGLLIVVTLL